MIYQYVKRYLKQTYTPLNSNFEWSVKDNKSFLQYIQKRYSANEFLQQISEVKEAFKDFFEPIGSIVFRYKEGEGIKLKLFSYKVEPKNSKDLKKILSIIISNPKAIKYPYQGQNDQIAILGKIRRELNHVIEESEESVNKKELIKYAIRLALKLGPKDIVIQLKRKYIVKIFEKNSVVSPQEDAPRRREGIENRYNGYTLEQIQETYKEIFESNTTNIGYFLQEVVKTLSHTTLDFRKIDNKYYEMNVLKTVHAELAKELSNYISVEEDYLLGVTGYLMREHFYEIHRLLAIHLLEAIYEQDENAIQFLLFYNGKVIIKDNKKYQIPALKNADGVQWNNTTVMNLCNQWMNMKKRKEKCEESFTQSDLKVKQIHDKLEQIEPETQKKEKFIVEITKELRLLVRTHANAKAELEVLQKSQQDSEEYAQKVVQMKELVQKSHHLQEKIKEAKKYIEQLKKMSTIALPKIELLEKQKRDLQADIEVYVKNLQTQDVKIQPIIDSIVNALMARQKLIEHI